MANVIGVAFKKAGKVYSFDTGRFSVEKGQLVVVETSRGLELGEVVSPARELPDGELTQPLRGIVRLGTEQDLERVEQNKAREVEAFGIAEQRIAAHGLEMKLVSVEYTFDHSKIVFYFTADGRVDFRELVKDLASIFKMRIELRQIGVRDEAKMIGGLGACGRSICCASFLGDFEPVSIKMAKEQNLLLNPTKISGLCGRLMCCLKYEQAGYEDAYRRVPKAGKDVMTPDGRGTVTQIKAIRERVTVRVSLPDQSTELRDYRFDELEPAKPLTPEELEARRRRAEEIERLAEARAEARAQRAAVQKPRPPKPPRQSMENYELRDADAAEPERTPPPEREARPPRPPRGQGQRQQGEKGERQPLRQGGGNRPPRPQGNRERQPGPGPRLQGTAPQGGGGEQ